MASAGAPERRRPRVLLGLSGSVACVKAEQLVAALSRFADVRVVATPAALRFLDPPPAPDAATPPRRDLAGAPLLTDATEWAAWRAVGDTVVHIALRRWADVLLVAPLSANSVAKLAGGLCDNLLTCVARAWDYGKPVLVAPAMNTAMWTSPFTGRHLAVLADLGVCVVQPVAKRCVRPGAALGVLAQETLTRACLFYAGWRAVTWAWARWRR